MNATEKGKLCQIVHVHRIELMIEWFKIATIFKFSRLKDMQMLNFCDDATMSTV